MAAPTPHRPGARRDRGLLVVSAGAVVGALGGLIGLGGAELRLPLLISLFGFAALPAIILNKALSLVVVLTALPARLLSLPPQDLLAQGDVAFNLLAGSLLGAYVGASVATRLRTAVLHRVLGVLLVLIAAALVASHLGSLEPLGLTGAGQLLAGVAAGGGIGVVAAVMGVAGGELLIPTLVLLYGLDVKVAGSVSLAVSLPTMLVAFGRYSRDGSFSVLRRERGFSLLMAAGSVLGTVVGALLVGIVPERVLVPLLATLLVVSAAKVWQSRPAPVL